MDDDTISPAIFGVQWWQLGPVGSKIFRPGLDKRKILEPNPTGSSDSAFAIISNEVGNTSEIYEKVDERMKDLWCEHVVHHPDDSMLRERKDTRKTGVHSK